MRRKIGAQVVVLPGPRTRRAARWRPRRRPARAATCPKALSLAPTRTRNLRPVLRSRASGPTKGLAASRPPTSLVNGGTSCAALSSCPECIRCHPILTHPRATRDPCRESICNIGSCVYGNRVNLRWLRPCHDPATIPTVRSPTMSTQRQADIGVVGMAVMGQNLALNIESRGYTVAVYNRTQSTLQEFVQRAGGRRLVPATSLAALAASLARPRRVLLMVQAGAAVDPCDRRPAAPPGARRHPHRRRQLLFRRHHQARAAGNRVGAALYRHRRLRGRGGRPARAQHHARRRPRRLRGAGADPGRPSPPGSTASPAAPTSAQTAPDTT